MGLYFIKATAQVNFTRTADFRKQVAKKQKSHSLEAIDELVSSER